MSRLGVEVWDDMGMSVERRLSRALAFVEGLSSREDTS